MGGYRSDLGKEMMGIWIVVIKVVKSGDFWFYFEDREVRFVGGYEVGCVREIEELKRILRLWFLGIVRMEFY